jgi:coenzyme F420-0:L-glutamate ligase/coenzyme F420-1:gamma-L-glutamate ligase
MQTSEFATLIKSRRSIRNWQDKPVPEQMLLDAIELATWAPNAGNQQNWRFFIILAKNTIKTIGDAVQAGRSYMSSWPEMAQARPAPPPGSPLLAPRMPLSAAPAIIAVGTSQTTNPMDQAMAKRAPTDPRAAQMLKWATTVDSRIQSVSAAVAYLLLVLHQKGLGAVWMTGPMPQCKGEIEKILRVPANMDIVVLVPVGYPAESPTRNRKSVREVCEIIR